MFREIFQNHFLPVFSSEDLSTISRGLIWGDVAGLPYAWKQALLLLGIYQLTTANGFHLQLFLWFLRPLRNLVSWHSYHLIEVFVVLYLAQGAATHPTYLRAILMWFLAWFFKTVGWGTTLLWRLMVVFFLFLVFLPATFGSLGIQLSFLSLLGIYFSLALFPHENKMQLFLQRKKWRVRLQKSLWMSGWVLLFIAPVLRFSTGLWPK